MNAHRFDPVSAVLGVIALIAGAAAMSGMVNPFDQHNAGAWIAVAIIAIGVAMLPWGGRNVPPGPARNCETDETVRVRRSE